MAAVDNSRYSDLCRLCATKTASTMVLGINIFDSDGTLRQISKKIECCLPIQVHEADELPKMICENCLYKLEIFHDFRERTIRTERLLIDLFKEINSTHIQNEHPPMNVVTLDRNELIMLQQHTLLGTHNIQNVSEIDLAHLSQRDGGIIVEHEIISLDNIDLNHHELTSQDLSNHSLQTQESLMVETSNTHSLPDAQFAEDNLDLIQQQHHLLTDQFKFQQDLQHVSVNEESALEMKHLHHERAFHTNDKIDSVLEESHTVDYQETHVDENSLTVDSHISDVTVHNNYSDSKLDILKQDDSNSGNSLLIDDRLNNVNETNKQVYILQIDNSLSENVVQQPQDEHENSQYYCNICGKSFEQKPDFEAHYEDHFFKCITCLAVFTNSDVLNSHRKEAHGASVEEVKPIKTRLKRATVQVKEENGVKVESNSEESEDDCDSGQIEEEEEVDDPLAEVGSKRKKWSPKVCKECGKSYKTNYKLTEHMRKHTGEKPYKCSSCEKAFRSKIGLAQHEAKHTGQYDYSCPICGKGFQCKSYLMVHQRVHSDIKPYPCTTCGRNFKTKQSLLDHTNRHLGVKPYMCETCGRGFITKGLCKAHQKIHTGLDNRKYSCKICNKMFVSKSYLQTHLRIHTGEKPFMCEVCGKGFLTRVDLRIHSTMHTGEKSYVCEMCGKAFARRDALRCHRRSHTGERPYSCDLCGQTFTQFTPMAIHKRLHTGERPYSCETCGKTFVSRSTMMSHAKKHQR